MPAQDQTRSVTGYVIQLCARGRDGDCLGVRRGWHLLIFTWMLGYRVHQRARGGSGKMVLVGTQSTASAVWQLVSGRWEVQWQLRLRPGSRAAAASANPSQLSGQWQASVAGSRSNVCIGQFTLPNGTLYSIYICSNSTWAEPAGSRGPRSVLAMWYCGASTWLDIPPALSLLRQCPARYHYRWQSFVPQRSGSSRPIYG